MYNDKVLSTCPSYTLILHNWLVKLEQKKVLINMLEFSC